jgi:hypothetical protein
MNVDLTDIWRLNLPSNSFASWTQVTNSNTGVYFPPYLLSSPRVFSSNFFDIPIATASMAYLNKQNATVYVAPFGGNNFQVYQFSHSNMSWSITPVSGNAPPARYGYSWTVLENKFWIFGGGNATEDNLGDFKFYGKLNRIIPYFSQITSI